MAKFLSHLVFFLFFFTLFLEAKPLYELCSGRYKENVLGREVYYTLAKSKKKHKQKKCVIGDSVARQFYDGKKDNDFLVSLATNQVIGVVGQSIILSSYLEAGNRPDTVFLMYSPLSFQNNLDQIFTYQYFLKPFYNRTYSPYFYLTYLPHILTSNWSPETIPLQSDSIRFLSPISVEYLKKIDALSHRYGFTLMLIPTPTKKSHRKSIMQWDKKEIASHQLTHLFRPYFEKLTYLPDSCFVDNVHLKHPNAIKPIVDIYLY